MNAFKSYDVRGVYPDEIGEELFSKIGLVISKLGYETIAVGRDARNSSDKLHLAFCVGLVNAGINVVDLGVVTSPMLSFFCHLKKVKGGMITASHNPKEFNGLKFVDENGIQLSYESFLFKVEKLVEKGDFKKYLSKTKGRVRRYDLTPDYISYMHDLFKNSFDRKLKVVFDCSNGVASIPLADLVKKLNIESIFINKKPDGNFPNHEPNQTIKKNLIQLQDMVRKNKADIGVMFDGDADRVGFVNDKGDIVDINVIFLLFAKNLIDKNMAKKPRILFDLRFSRYVFEFLELYGARPEIMKVGNPFYKKLMLKDKSILLSGELSGHIMFGEHFGIDDSIFAALRLIEIVSHREKKLSEIEGNYRKYYTADEVSLPAKDIEKTFKKITHHYRKDKKKYLDGVSVIKKKVWFNVRKSNTEKLVRIVAEGTSKEDVENEMSVIKKMVEND